MEPQHKWHQLDGPYYARATADEVGKMVEQRRGWIADNSFPTPRANQVIALDDRIIGVVTRYWQSKETNWLSVGIVIYDPAQWGKGYGFQALGLWSEYLFKQMPELVRLDLRTWSGNIGMMALAQKLGYKEEACFRKARIVDGAYYDGMGYGVLREEWEALYPQGFKV